MNIDEKLRKVFHRDDSYQKSALQDLFAIGCYFHAIGQTGMGLKTCATALRGAHCKNSDEIAILKFVPGNELACFEAAWPHSELRHLKEEMTLTPSET